MMATLREVADRSGLSKSLVSLALRGDDGVTFERRTAAVESADALGYPVSVLARRRAAGDRLAIAALVTERGNPFHDDVASSVLRTASGLGFEVDVIDGCRDLDILTTGLGSVVASAGERDGALGVVVVSSWFPPAVLRAAAGVLPVAVVGSAGETLAQCGVDTVRSTEEAGMHALVLHLATLGHEQICFVGESDQPSTTRRGDGFHRTIRWLYGPAAARSTTIGAVERDREQVTRLLEEGVTAFVAANDSTASRFLAATRGTGRAERAMITGFDNTELAGRLNLTSVDQPRERMGARAVELVLERLRGRRVERHDLQHASLVARASTLGTHYSARIVR